MTSYAGFWLRFVAFIIDTIIIYVVQAFILVPLFAFMGFSFAVRSQNMENMSEAEAVGFATAMMATVGIASLITTVANLLYGTLMESSKYQGTVGKLALGLRVTDVDGQKLDFTKSLIRNIGKLVSAFILFIGYIMVAFTEKSQGLHDIIANTLVVKKGN